MSLMLTIAKREFASYFRTSIGWVILALYLLMSGFYVSFATLHPGEPASLRAFFNASQWFLLIVVPGISMKLLADEFRTGSYETLAASPASEWHVVPGKFAGAVGFLAFMLICTLPYPLLLEWLARPDPGPIVTGYLALLLAGSVYLSIGVFFSSLTENQVVAMLATLFALVALEVLSNQLASLASPRFEAALYALSVSRRVGDLAKGALDVAHLVHAGSFIAVFLSASVIALESRRWR